MAYLKKTYRLPTLDFPFTEVPPGPVYTVLHLFFHQHCPVHHPTSDEGKLFEKCLADISRDKSWSSTMLGWGGIIDNTRAITLIIGLYWSTPQIKNQRIADILISRVERREREHSVVGLRESG